MSMAGGRAAQQVPVVAADCVICGTALSGPLGYLFRAVGISRSSRNPNLCNRCNTHTEEGRIVELTVLFADISSFTELTHELGPERTHQVVDAFLKSVTYILVKHGAFIDKYVGDAVMAFFNVPIRSEDHGARAVEAAREILAELPSLRERLGIELNASLGIASGWAHVGRLGSGDNKDYTAIGDVVNLAARLEGQARSGEIVVDDGVHQQIAARYPEQAPETLALKGFKEPVTAYRLSATSAPVAPAATASAHRELLAGRSFNLGAIVFAMLGAPCAAVALIGPLAVVLGLGSLFGALGTNVFPVLDSAPVRIPLLTLATLGSVANLYTLWHARRLRQQAAAEERFIPVTQLEQRRARLVLASAVFTLLVVAYELYAHEFVTHHPWP